MKTNRKSKRSRGVKEPAGVYSVTSDKVSVREAKDNLSALLDLAAAGKDIIITSDGRPKAMLVRYRERLTAKPYQADRSWLLSQPVTPDSTGTIRAERDAQG